MWKANIICNKPYMSTKFCSKPTFAEHHPTIASKRKQEKAIHESAKLFSSHEKMKKCFSSHEKIHFIRKLSTKTLFNKNIKYTIVSYEMKISSVHYHTIYIYIYLSIYIYIYIDR